ncbi:MAG TPA: hypothetical protein VE968_03590 [Sphingomicrobium sp.]|nr:hypothetical protein [Sphingomicrobium sp.]
MPRLASVRPRSWKVRNLVLGFAITAFSVGEAHSAQAPVRYACSTSENLTLVRTSQDARVQLGGHSYELKRARSSIGSKYLSTNAALIIDGPSLIFVADDNPNLGPCVKAVPVAATR